MSVTNIYVPVLTVLIILTFHKNLLLTMADFQQLTLSSAIKYVQFDRMVH